MVSRSAGTRSILLALAPALALPAAAFAQCPSADQLAANIQEVFKRPGIEVKKVAPAPLKGLCEVLVSLQGRQNILYADATGAFFVTGHLIDVKGGKDVTEEALQALNVIPADEMKKIDGLVAMTLGSKGKAVYFVTDPQ